MFSEIRLPFMIAGGEAGRDLERVVESEKIKDSYKTKSSSIEINKISQLNYIDRDFLPSNRPRRSNEGNYNFRK